MMAEGQSLSSLRDEKFKKVQKKEMLSFCMMLSAPFKLNILTRALRKQFRSLSIRPSFKCSPNYFVSLYIAYSFSGPSSSSKCCSIDPGGREPGLIIYASLTAAISIPEIFREIDCSLSTRCFAILK